jgi:AAA+ superfamily predicted ATPase
MTQANTTGSTQAALTEIDTLIRARYPILYLLTHEEIRLESLVGELAKKQAKQLFTWTATQGLRLFQESGAATERGGHHDPVEVINHILSVNSAAVFLLKDFHPFLEDPHVIRRLRDAAHELKGTYKNILIASPRLNLPVELEKDVTLIDIPLPDPQELFDLLKSVCTTVAQKNKNSVKLNTDEGWALVRAAHGLTLTEAENAFAKAVVNDGVFDAKDIALVLKEKQQLIRKSGILEFYPADSNLSEIGGLHHLKHWLVLRGKAFSMKASGFGLPAPRGVLLLGAPGCGKSLTAKAVAKAWQMPLLRLDFGKIFSGLVGSSEENMRRALKVAEGISPAVLWIDEIEKGLAGGASGVSDGGTGARVFGTFLTWMQEKTSTVFVVATANRIDALPPELMRRGRFDEIFFMDLPQAAARAEILTIHLKKRNRKPEAFDVQAIVTATEGFSGAEIEHVLIEGLFTAYHQNRDLKTEDILQAIQDTVPLSVTYSEELKRIRDWSKNRARLADLSVADATSTSRASRLEVKR